MILVLSTGMREHGGHLPDLSTMTHTSSHFHSVLQVHVMNYNACIRKEIQECPLLNMMMIFTFLHTDICHTTWMFFVMSVSHLPDC